MKKFLRLARLLGALGLAACHSSTELPGEAGNGPEAGEGGSAGDGDSNGFLHGGAPERQGGK